MPLEIEAVAAYPVHSPSERVGATWPRSLRNLGFDDGAKGIVKALSELVDIGAPSPCPATRCRICVGFPTDSKPQINAGNTMLMGSEEVCSVSAFSAHHGRLRQPPAPKMNRSEFLLRIKD
jgi:hypothetical protein